MHITLHIEIGSRRYVITTLCCLFFILHLTGQPVMHLQDAAA